MLKKDCGIYVSEIADVCLHVSVGVRSHVCTCCSICACVSVLSGYLD